MTKRSKKPLLIPIILTSITLFLILTYWFSFSLIIIDLAEEPTITPSITRDGNNFSGWVEIKINYNITNKSPATLHNINVNISITLSGIEHINAFPDATILKVTESIDKIASRSNYQGCSFVNISSITPILAIIDAYLVLDVDIFFEFDQFPLRLPLHFIARIQDYWEAPFDIPLLTSQ